MDIYSALKVGAPVSPDALIGEINKQNSKILEKEDGEKVACLLKASANLITDRLSFDINSPVCSIDTAQSLYKIFVLANKVINFDNPSDMPVYCMVYVSRILQTEQYPRTLIMLMRRDGLFPTEFAVYQKALSWEDLKTMIAKDVNRAKLEEKLNPSRNVSVKKQHITVALLQSPKEKEFLDDLANNGYDFSEAYLSPSILFWNPSVRKIISAEKAVELYEKAESRGAGDMEFFNSLVGYRDLPCEFVKKYPGIYGISTNNFTFFSTHDINDEIVNIVGPSLHLSPVGFLNKKTIQLGKCSAESFDPELSFFQYVDYKTQMKLKDNWIYYSTDSSAEIEDARERFICSIIIGALFDKVSVDERIEENTDEFFCMNRSALIDVLKFGALSKDFLERHLDDFAKHKLKSVVNKMLSKM